MFVSRSLSVHSGAECEHVCQYLYFCTSAFVLVKQVNWARARRAAPLFLKKEVRWSVFELFCTSMERKLRTFCTSNLVKQANFERQAALLLAQIRIMNI